MSNLQTAAMIAISMGMLLAWYALLLRLRPPWGRGAMAVTLWVAAIGFLGAWGFFADFESIPSRLPLFVTFISGVVISVIFFSRRGRHLLQNPQWTLLGLQAFRAPLEMLFAHLAADGQLPVEMSYYGRSFDFLTGITAPVMAAVSYRFGERRMKVLIVIWNLLGLVSLFNVVGLGLLSSPTPFQVLDLGQSSGILGAFPMMWWPLFLAPTAFVLHFLSLRRALRKSV